MSKLFQLATLFFFITSCAVFAQSPDSLRYKIQQIVANKNATVGVSIIGNDGKDTISFYGDQAFPMQSVFKFHIALAVLSQIDEGKFTLDQKVVVQKNELLPKLWSPLREDNPNGGTFPISKLIEYAVSLSDNVACDELLRLIGGPEVVEAYMKKNGIKDIAIKINEEHMQANWNDMFLNWTTPKAASETLSKFYHNKNKLLSRKSYNFIWKTMKATQTGEGKIKGKLPKGTVVAHKTGSSGMNKDGLTAAANDIGIVFLPDGKYFFISVFVSNSKETEETNDQIIADIAKVTWDYYTKKKN
jgi:beta-lactamase class A